MEAQAATLVVDVLLFGALRERAAADRITVRCSPSATCADLVAAVADQYPQLAPYLGSARVALDRRYAYGDELVASGRELALIPPVAGGAARIAVHLTSQPIDVAAVHAAIADPTAGGHTVFVGRVRNHHEGRTVAELSYEAYEPMAKALLEQILAATAAAHDLTAAIVVHRLGRLRIGDAAIALGVSAAHRDATFAAVAAAMDAIKRDVPIFKRETYQDGSHTWVRCHHHLEDTAR